jgi:PAB-dependent poly(A)-specific ribonuclease subunit 2
MDGKRLCMGDLATSSAIDRSDTEQQGRVTSFYGTKMQLYTSFKAHLSADGPIRQMLVNDKGIIALGSKDLHMALRRGPPIWHIR